MKILTICDSFKGTLSSKEIGIIVSNELNNKGYTADYVSISDGGEGFIDSFSEILKSHNFKVSTTIVAASKTVGTPIPITGTPKVSFESSSCLFPTPPPGTIPVSEICIDLFILSIFFEHKLSIAITKLGFTLSSIPLTTSIVSIPVVPKTPWNYRTYRSNIFINSIWYILFYMSCNFYIFYNLCT